MQKSSRQEKRGRKREEGVREGEKKKGGQGHTPLKVNKKFIYLKKNMKEQTFKNVKVPLKMVLWDVDNGNDSKKYFLTENKPYFAFLIIAFFILYLMKKYEE